MHRDDDPKTARMLLVGAIGIVLFFVVVVGLQTLYYWTRQRELEKKTYSRVPRELHEMVQKQQMELTEYAYIDQEKRVVALPIERAMELVTSELENK